MVDLRCLSSRFWQPFLCTFPKQSTPRLSSSPREGADPIQSPRLATVNRVSVTEGQTVAAGAELFVLRSDEIRAFDTQLQTLTEDLHTQELTLAKMDEAYAAEANIKNAQVSQAESELRFREKQTASNRELLNRLEKLSKSGGFSQIDLIKLQLEAAGAEKDQAVAQRTLEQVKLERQQLENQNSRKRAEQAGEVQKLKMKLGALKGDLENSQKELADDSRTLRRRHHFPGSAQCRQRCAKWTGALPAWTHRRQTARALDAERVRPGEVKIGSIGAVFLRSVSVSTLRRAQRKARLGEPVRGRGSKRSIFRWAGITG